VTADAGTASTVNHAIAAGAHTHIYTHPAHDHLAGIQLPGPGPIPRIQGPPPIDARPYIQPITMAHAR
jgi:hypothetical protein